MCRTIKEVPYGIEKEDYVFGSGDLTTCAISVTAFADMGYFGPTTLMKASGASTTSEKKKTDLEDAVVNVTSGLTGDYCMTFRVRCYESAMPRQLEQNTYSLTVNTH